MNEAVSVILALLTGLLLGATFFGVLWWTVRRSFSSRQPALWFLGSMLLRTSIVLAGFYFVSRDHWERLVGCLFGFVVGRLLVMRFNRVAEKPTSLGQVARHAP